MQRYAIDQRQARRFMLAHQGLWPPLGKAGKSAILSFMRRVGCIQFDPLNIVGHNHELVLQARLAGFQPHMLQELLYSDRLLLDGWDKNMSIYRTEDWPYFSRRRKAAAAGLGASNGPLEEILPRVRLAVEEQGPLSSADIKLELTVDWAWGPTRAARAALESLYFCGELVVHHRVYTRRVYDFTHRHLPPELLAAPDPNRTAEQYHDWHVHRRVGAVGMLWNRPGDAWLGISGFKSRERQAAVARLLGQGKLIPIQVAGIETPLYVRREDQPALEQSLETGPPPPRAAILAPLDNMLWDRRLIRALFGFDYCWEVYKPAAQRRHGYYVLPVLYGDRFVARFDPGRDKQSGALVIKNWWWEPGVRPSKTMHAALRACFSRFLGCLGAPGLRLEPAAAETKGLDWLKEYAEPLHT